MSSREIRNRHRRVLVPMPFWKFPEEVKRRFKSRIRAEMIPKYFRTEKVDLDDLDDKVDLRLYPCDKIIGKATTTKMLVPVERD